MLINRKLYINSMAIVSPIVYKKYKNKKYWYVTIPKEFDRQFIGKKLFVSVSGNQLVYTTSGGKLNA